MLYSLTMESSNQLTNHFLIAMPNLADPNFYRTVSYVCEHNETGIVAIIINRPMQLTLGEVFSQLGIDDPDPVVSTRHAYYGGPIKPEHGFVIHKEPGIWRSTLQVDEDIHITTSRDILEAMARGQGPTHAIVALGYAGWSCSQLDEEIARNAWLSCKADEKILFHTPYPKIWESAAKLLGIDIHILSGDTGHA